MTTETVEEMFATDCQHPSRKVEDELKARREGRPLVCGGCGEEVVPTYWIAPEGSPWLVVQDLQMIEETMRPGEEDDVWEIKRVYMRPSEVDALPAHEGF